MFLIASKLLLCSCTHCFYLFGALFVSDFFCLLIFVYLMLFMGIYLEYGWNICTFKGLPLLNYSIGCQALISVYPGLMFPSLLQLEWSITFSPAITTIYVPPSTCFPELVRLVKYCTDEDISPEGNSTPLFPFMIAIPVYIWLIEDSCCYYFAFLCTCLQFSRNFAPQYQYPSLYWWPIE